LGKVDIIAWRNWLEKLPWDKGPWPEREAFEDYSYRSFFEHLTTVRRAGPLFPDDFPLICVLRNEAMRLPLFFDHYKNLGVTRFIMIDNDSDDGSRDILLSEPSADIFFTSISFSEGQNGLYWANSVAHALCDGHWTLRVDADELLVYDGMDRHGLADLAKLLGRRDRDRIFAPMRDVYPSSSLDAESGDIARMLAQDCWFDGEGYTTEKWREGWHIGGGPRERLFGREHLYWLAKYPFFRMTKDISIFNHHYLWPFDTSLDQPMGALLHLKLLGDFVQRSGRYEREGQHSESSHAYKIANSVMAEKGLVSAHYKGSRRYVGPQSLIECGLMQPIDWNK
jgi:hypothetical protein